MILTMPTLKKFIYSLKDKKINQISITKKELKILINKNKRNTKIYTQNITRSNNLEKINSKDNTYKKSLNDNKQNHKINKHTIAPENDSKIYSTIISPMVGTFYKSPAPNEAAFIEKNDIVQKKQIVCIIEAMKLMNEIESEVHGEIIEMLVNDGDIVDCGQALMKVKIL
uniref:Biotin carboxyl carrier protein of acetyl-CoA carboxylase n=1 Tax=Cumathamnion serrulatum TaxID=1206573 RepID=A0A7U1G3V3_9FLOR|nr:acetyl-CoA carboxylase biotin carboxyl carrier protein [Cumathamnion serrulatum]QQY85339.1 acetyl-CoA carboxylase biotin carboxyl carrier protein [Cumathamnion serrulatum]